MEGLRELNDYEIVSLSVIMKSLDKVISEMQGVENVYVCSFTEETRHFHYHVFPRYDWMAEEISEQLYAGNKLDGAKVFSYYRKTLKCSLDRNNSSLVQVVDSIRMKLIET